MTVAELRAWAEARVTQDAEAGLIPVMSVETGDRLDVVLGDLSPWRTSPTVRAAA